MAINNPWIILVALIGFLVAFAFVFLVFRPWLLCALAESPISIAAILSMRRRRVKVDQIVIAYITARKAGVHVDIAEIESLYHEGPRDFFEKVQRLISKNVTR